MNECIHATRFFWREVAGNVKARNLTRNLRAEGGRIESGDAGDARFASDYIGPALRYVKANGGDNAKAGHYDSASCQIGSD
jgi:hypothetical protein